MKRIFLFIASLLLLFQVCTGQDKSDTLPGILFHGVILDATTLAPVSSAQIMINRVFSAISNTDGTFSFYVSRSDSIRFRHLGYKAVSMFVSDTLRGNDFVAGVYMPSDTVSISEVIIVPRYTNLKSEIMNSPSKIPATMDNARYNVAVSGYAGRSSTGKLGDPSSNYGLIRQQQKTYAYEKGEIPSDQIAGISPFFLLPAAYLLIHGLPEKPAPYGKKITQDEMDRLNKLFIESLKIKK